MTTVFIVIMCALSGFIGYEIGSDECHEYKASVQLEQALERIKYLEQELDD